MTIGDLKSTLASHHGKPITIQLPDGETIPPHFHVTEVGFAKKDFIDCGGKIRTEGKCLLQIWVATDTDHRVDGDKLAAILKHGAPVLPTDALPVEIEYNHPGLTHFPLAHFEATNTSLTLHLSH
ncbi:MAG: DUF6428 family protein [Verrucomicrobia bacterium]|nr:DUF6428 family protein [Verrucomicrobiota bacterium]